MAGNSGTEAGASATSALRVAGAQMTCPGAILAKPGPPAQQNAATGQAWQICHGGSFFSVAIKPSFWHTPPIVPGCGRRGASLSPALG